MARGKGDADDVQLSLGILGVRPSVGPPPEPPPAPPLPAPPVPAPPAESRVFGVGELVRSARLMLEARFADVRVEGEISGFKRSGPGHLYFTLKDGEAQIDCVMFSREAARLKFEARDGLLVRCRGRLTIYEGRGKFQMTVTAVEPAGAGALALAFEQLKRRLSAEGLFDAARKRPLPFLPRRLGVVTSPHGAVIRDIIRVAHRRFPMPILLAAAPVQGDGIAPLLIGALERLARVRDVDVIIVARGGGSLEDLWAFNDEGLARAIAACRVPVVSAVGHETDFTIADFVADLRAPTPSAAAELAVPVAAELRGELDVICRRVTRALSGRLQGYRLVLERARSRVGDPRRLLDARRQRIDELGSRGAGALRLTIKRRRGELRTLEGRLLRAHPQRRIADQRAALAAAEKRLSAAAASLMGRRRRGLSGMQATLEALSPLRVLERGYGLVRGPDGHVITGADGIAVGQDINVTLRRGELGATITRVDAGEENGKEKGELPPAAPSPQRTGKAPA